MKKILCIGDLCLDVLIPYENTLELIRKGSVAQEKVTYRHGGTVANTASVLGRLNEDVVLVTDMGDMEIDQYLRKELIDCGVDMSMSIPGNHSIMDCLVVLGKDGERTIFPFLPPGTDYPKFTKDSFQEALFKESYYIFTSGMILNNDLETMESTYQFIKSMKEKNGSVFVFDLNARFATYGLNQDRRKYFELYIELADILLGSGDVEFLPLTTCKNMLEAARTFVTDQRIVIARNGSHPVHILQQGKESVIEVPKVVPINTTGAGDVFNAAFMKCLRHGLKLENAVSYASYIASYVISHKGHFELPDDALIKFEELKRE